MMFLSQLGEQKLVERVREINVPQYRLSLLVNLLLSNHPELLVETNLRAKGNNPYCWLPFSFP